MFLQEEDRKKCKMIVIRKQRAKILPLCCRVPTPLVSGLNKEWPINEPDKFYSQEIDPPKNQCIDQGLLINAHKPRDIVEQRQRRAKASRSPIVTPHDEIAVASGRIKGLGGWSCTLNSHHNTARYGSGSGACLLSFRIWVALDRIGR